MRLEFRSNCFLRKIHIKKAYQSSHAGLQLGCRLQVAGRHLATRAAPRRPKVNQQRDLVALQMLVKRRLDQVNRLASK